MTASKALKGFLLPFVNTSVGRKTVMSLTGIGVIGFLVVHLLGNTVAFEGESAFNTYARSLHAIPFLPLLEAALGMLFLAHIALGVVLTLQNLAARPTAYAVRGSAGAKTFASTTMIYTGVVILSYMLYHVWTISIAPVSGTPAFERVKAALSSPVSASLYLVGLTALAIHVSHGASSALLTLGLRHPRHDAWVDLFGKVAAVLVSATFAAIVVWFLAFGGPAPEKKEANVPEPRLLKIDNAPQPGGGYEP